MTHRFKCILNLSANKLLIFVFLRFVTQHLPNSCVFYASPCGYVNIIIIKCLYMFILEIYTYQQSGGDVLTPVTQQTKNL